MCALLQQAYHNLSFVLSSFPTSFISPKYSFTSHFFLILADVIMDVLVNQKLQHVVTKHYEESEESTLVSKAVAEASTKVHDKKNGMPSSKHGSLK